jgi:peroxiredoxin
MGPGAEFSMRDVTVRAFFLAGLLAVAQSAAGDEGFLPGHSHRGEAFDRGPRQRAYLMGGTGNVHFPISSKDPLVQKFVEQGIGQLHGFWFVEAERSFRQAARLDPNCGIAYWGLSLANQELNPVRARQFAAEAAKHKAGLSDRERMYIEAIGDKNSYRAIVAKYPQDLEAKAFEVWRLWHEREKGNSSQSILDAADALTGQILRVDPMHPIHHAAIHFADSANAVGRALNSAARCGDAAPAIGHMWHMPTHVYFPLKRYPEAAWQLEAAIRTENARVIHDRALPSHLYAHNNEWLVRTLLFLGRVHDARRIAMNMIDLPRHPLFNTIVSPDAVAMPEESEKARPKENFGSSALYGRKALIQLLRQYEYWDELIDLCRTGYLEPTGSPAEMGEIRANLGIACYCRGTVDEGDEELAKLRILVDDQIAAQTAALDELTGRPEKDRTDARSSVDARFAPSISRLMQQADDLETYRRIVTGFYIDRPTFLVCLAVLLMGEATVFWLLRRKLAIALLTLLITLLVGVGILRYHLALLNMPYNADNVDLAFMCRMLLKAGDDDEAEWSARNFVKERTGQVRPQATLVEVLYKAGKKADARTEFARLRELAATADLDSPPLARLAPIASEFGFPNDWRLPQKVQRTLEARRPLASLGPLLWRPGMAPNWTLKDADGQLHSLTDFRGKPVVLIFSLGEGCLHCRAQLESFGKKAHQFADAGLTVIVISSDDEARIKKSLSSYKPASFPFMMLADPQLQAFQSFGAFDDFEQIALHGTFLVDGQGFARWSDVNFEPFTDAEFVISESKRLLSRPLAAIEFGARVIGEDKGT